MGFFKLYSIVLLCSFLLIELAAHSLASFSVSQYPYNPMLIPSAATWPTSDCDNIYSQEIVYWQGNTLLMFYGGWEGTANYCHDQIFMASSTDGGATWRKYPNDNTPSPVLPLGDSQHVNDPSIVITNGQVMMYYTDNRMIDGSLTDQVWLATSNYVTGFQKWGMIIDVKTQPWCQLNAGRPAVIFDEGIYKMWYDCTANNIRSVGYATSSDGYHFTNYAENPLFQNGGGIDVKKINGTYYMLQEGRPGSTISYSDDGINWTNEGIIVPISGKYYDAYGQVVPSFQVNPNGTLEAIWFGGATNNGWDQNTINVAYPTDREYPAGGGCTGCVSPGDSCSRQCQLDNVANSGLCGAPGSTNSGQCCKCYNDGCQGCVVNAADCYEACTNAGHATGYCGSPGSTNPNDCCACS